MPELAPPARERALTRLLRIEEEGAYANRLAADDLDADDAREERQAGEYVAGITRWKRWLDFLIGEFYRGDASRLEAPLRQILRIGLYDLLMQSTPSHAAVNEAVELTKTAVRPQAAGLVNGILRAAARQRDQLPLPDTGDPIDDLAITHSVPTWLAKRWVDRWGLADASELLEAANQRPAYALRVNTLRTTVDETLTELAAMDVRARASEVLDDFVVTERLQPVMRAGWFDQGRCAVQDEAAGLVVRLLDPQPGETVIDAAAAPGGKSVYAGIRMRNEGRLLALDLHRRRIKLVAISARAHGLTIVETEAADLREFAARESGVSADRVLLDAPCSGLGVLSKRADLRWRRSEDDFAELCVLQDELLDAAARLVRPGGLMVYSTCTIEPEENQQRVEAFLKRHADFSFESAKGWVPDAMVTEDGYYLALPHRHGTDGAFGARLRRALR